MQRTTLIVILVLCLVVPALTGCSLFPWAADSSDAPPAQTSSTTPPADGVEEQSADTLGRVTVPYVVDLDAASAQEALADARLKANFEWRRDDSPHRTVLEQSFAGGEMLPPGAYVHLIVSLGPTPTVPPAPMVLAALQARADAAAAAAAQEEAASDDGGTTPDETPGGSGTITPQSENDIPGVPLTSSPVSGILTLPDPSDVYSISFLAGQARVFSVDLGGTVTDPDFQIKVYGPTATSVDSDSPLFSTTTGDYPRNLTFTATTTGLFYIQVYHAGTAALSGGQYVLTWSGGS